MRRLRPSPGQEILGSAGVSAVPETRVKKIGGTPICDDVGCKPFGGGFPLTIRRAKMTLSIARTLIALFAVTLAAPASAEVLLLQTIQEAPENSPSGLERPKRGLTMLQVESRFGAPEERVTSVGDPPIARWLYPDYTVFFEYDRVIETVVHKNREAR